MKRYLKREIKFVLTEDLNTRFCHILKRAEILNAEDIPVADAREILWIEDELHERIIKAVGHDFYPPDVIKPTIAELKASIKASLINVAKPKPKPVPVYHATQVIHPCSAAVVKKVELEKKTESKLGFKITITSSIGSVVSTQNVKVDSKDDADVMACTIIEQLGLKKAKYKIS